MPTSPSVPQKRRSIVYIDGYNLYYNAIKGTSFKWLNLQKLFTNLRTSESILQIKYFTAPANGPGRYTQAVYWEALETQPLVKIIKGKHKNKGFFVEFSG